MWSKNIIEIHSCVSNFFSNSFYFIERRLSNKNDLLSAWRDLKMDLACDRQW